ncbi:MAG: caspase family protein, partial [Planctomycetota bacterium]
AIGWNTQARILAAADQLGRITVWRMDSEKKTSIRSGSKQLWNVVWDDTGTKLRFADRNYPNGRYHYNRYGGVTHEFDTRRLILREQRVDVEDRPIDLKTPFGVLGFRDAKFNWVRIDEQAVRRLIRGPAVDLNACEELPAEFGTVMSYLSSSYPGVSDEHLFLGTNRGHVVEIAIQRGVSRSVVHRPVRWFLGHTGAVTSLAMSPDRSLLATSSLDGTIRVWSLTPPRITGDLDAKMVGSTVAKFESGGRAYEAGLIPYQDRIIRFDDTTFFGRRRGLVQNKYRPGDRVPITAVNADGQPRTLEIVLQRSPDYAVPLWNLYLDSKGEWVAWTGQGYYAASSQGGKHIGWHINKDRHQVADFYTAEQFGRHLHQRQIVIDTMRLRSAEKATESAMESLTLLAKRPKAIESSSYEAFKAVLPPAISNLRVRQGDASGQPINVTFDVSHHRDRPLREAQLMINGRRVLASRSPVKSVEDPDHEGIMLASFNQSVLVENQIDSVSVRVTDRYGMHDFKNAQAFEWMPSVLESSARSDEELESVLYVLSIGVSQYRNPDMQLQFADRDAREFAKTWADRGRTVFSRVVTRTLMNSDATVDSIEESLDWLRKQSIQPQDLAIVFLAGHGIIDQDGDWYFACVDCDFKQ